MPFDLRPRFPELPSEGQIEEGGENSHANCVPASFDFCLLALGYPDRLSPQEIMDGTYGPGHAGGVNDPTAMRDWLAGRSDLYPGLPEIRIDDTDGLGCVQLADAYGSLGYPMFGAFYCDSAARILPAGSPGIVATHASCIVAFDGQAWTIWNVWTGFEQQLSNHDMVQAFSPGPWLVSFLRSILPTPQGASMIILDPNGNLHIFEVDPGRSSLTHRWSAHPDAELDLETLPPGQEETLPGPAGCLIDPASVAVTIKGDDFNIKVRTTDPAGQLPAGVGVVQMREQSWARGFEAGKSRDWRILAGIQVPLVGTNPPGGSDPQIQQLADQVAKIKAVLEAAGHDISGL
jgi:hypothetical protein